MIVVLRSEATDAQALAVERALRAAGGEPRRLESERRAYAVQGVSAQIARAIEAVAEVFDDTTPHPRASRPGDRTSVIVRGEHRIGRGAPVQIVAGPCAVESPEQLETIAAACASHGIRLMRGGAFKPRTSPYSFRGHGMEAMQWLRAAADRHGLAVVTEVMELGTVDGALEYADVLQIGSRNMQNFPLLAAVGRTRKPVLLKRGMSATLEEWLLAAEYVLEGGNDQVILCERGVRSFDPAARNLLDVAAVPLLRARTHLPVMVDPSHGVGVRDAVIPMACAAIAAGADGVMVEVHPDPGSAKSDGFQALTLPMLADMVKRVRAVEMALTRA
jgi:3-deoxy-7-phosphoheptulonate synthase